MKCTKILTLTAYKVQHVDLGGAETARTQKCIRPGRVNALPLLKIKDKAEPTTAGESPKIGFLATPKGSASFCFGESPSGNSKNGVTDGARDSGKAGITARPEGLSEVGNPSAPSAEPTPIFNYSIRRFASVVNSTFCVENFGVNLGSQPAKRPKMTMHEKLRIHKQKRK